MEFVRNIYHDLKTGHDNPIDDIEGSHVGEN